MSNNDYDIFNFRKTIKPGDVIHNINSEEEFTVTDEYYLEFANAQLEQMKQYGARDIEEWQALNWGSIGDIFNFRFKGNTFTFYSDTYKPVSGFETISKMYPDVVFSLKYSFDDCAIIQGKYIIKNGEITKETFSVIGSSIKEHYSIAFEVLDKYYDDYHLEKIKQEMSLRENKASA